MYKAMASLHAAILFAIVASPATYGLTQKLFGGLFKVATGGAPTVAGLLLHALVFGLLTYAIMWLHRPASGCGCGACQWREPWFKKYDLEDEQNDMESEDVYEDDMESAMPEDVYEDDMEDDM